MFALYWSWPLALLTCFNYVRHCKKLGWRSTSNNESYIKVFISCELCWGCLSCGLEDVTCNPIVNAVSLFIWTLLPGFLRRVSTLHFVWRRVLGHTRLRLDSSLPVAKFSCCVEYRCWRLFSRQCHIQSINDMLPQANWIATEPCTRWRIVYQSCTTPFLPIRIPKRVPNCLAMGWMSCS